MPNTDDIKRFIVEIVDRISKIDPNIGLVLLITLFLLLLSLYTSVSGATVDGIESTISLIKFPLLVSIFTVLILGGLKNTLLGKISTYIIIFYLLAGAKQFMFPALPPAFPPFFCFINPMTKSCPGSSEYSDASISTTPSSQISNTRPQDNPSTANNINESKRKRLVFLQFAGSIPRDKVIELASELSGLGWNMQGRDRGGERTPAAAGFNEIRYFKPEDKDLATQLALDVMSKANWVSRNVEIRLIPLSSATAQTDQIEIWISQ